MASLPSGVTATAFTQPMCQEKTWACRPLTRSHTRTVLSSEADRASPPTGATATAFTVPSCPERMWPCRPVARPHTPHGAVVRAGDGEPAVRRYRYRRHSALVTGEDPQESRRFLAGLPEQSGVRAVQRVEPSRPAPLREDGVAQHDGAIVDLLRQESRLLGAVPTAEYVRLALKEAELGFEAVSRVEIGLSPGHRQSPCKVRGRRSGLLAPRRYPAWRPGIRAWRFRRGRLRAGWRTRAGRRWFALPATGGGQTRGPEDAGGHGRGSHPGRLIRLEPARRSSASSRSEVSTP